MRDRLLHIALCVLICLSIPASAQATFEFISSPVGPTWFNFALNKDGNVMAANYGGEIFRWTATDGFVDLGMGDFLNSSIGISGDGLSIVAGRVGPDGATNPALWQQGKGWTNLGHPAEGCSLDNSWGSGYGLNSDGTIAVGLAWYCPGAEGFTWSEQSGMVGLSHPATASSRASAISADGSTIVGFFEDPRFGNRRPVLWHSGHTDLFAGKDGNGEATAVSSDGSQIVGQAVDTSGFGRPFYYTKSAGMLSLGSLTGHATDQGISNGVSDAGVVVGWTGDPFSAPIRAFIWSAKTGLRWMRASLVRNGAVISSDIILDNALGISADGSTIVGTWEDANFNFGAWIAHLKKGAQLK